MSINHTRREWLKLSALSATAMAFTPTAFQTAVKAQSKSNKVIELWRNENPYGYSPKVKQALLDTLADSNRYSSPALVAKLEKEIAIREGIKPENVIIGTGSGEVLCAAGIAFGLGKGEIVSPAPTFAQLALYAQKFNAKIINVPLNAKFEHDLEAMKRKINDKTSLVYICNPNNPTATVTPNSDLKKFCQNAGRRTTVFVDEAYLEYTEDFPRNSMVELVKKGENIIITRTFSKIYGMAGLRIGYGLAKTEIAKKIKNFRMTWFNRLSMTAAIASLKDKNFVPINRQRNNEVRKIFYKDMDKLKIKYTDSHANFVWLRTNDPELPQKLATQGILVGARNPFVGFDGLRVAIGTPNEMKKLVRALKKSKGKLAE